METPKRRSNVGVTEIFVAFAFWVNNLGMKRGTHNVAPSFVEAPSLMCFRRSLLRMGPSVAWEPY